MLHQQRPPAPSPVPPPVVAPTDTRPRTARAPTTPPRSTQALNARGDLSRAGKVRSPVA